MLLDLLCECPWKNVFSWPSDKNALNIVSVVNVNTKAIHPPVRPLDKHIKSGFVDNCILANGLPVRPNPVRTSSAIKRTPRSLRDFSTSSRTLRSCIIIPPAPCNSGSYINAAGRSSSSMDSRMALSLSRFFSLGVGRYSTSKNKGSKALLKVPRSPTDIAPKVSPWYAHSRARERRAIKPLSQSTINGFEVLVGCNSHC